MQRTTKAKDPVAPHAERLVSYMNGHPDTLLGYAKYFGDVNTAVSARMTDIDSQGFSLNVTKGDGTEEDLSIMFKYQLNGSDQVRLVLTDMAQEAEDALGLPSTRPPGSSPSLSDRLLYSKRVKPRVHTPFVRPDPLLTPIIVSLMLLQAYVVFIPNPPQLVQIVRDTLGEPQLIYLVYATVSMHCLEAIVAVWILEKRGEEDIITWLLWVVSTILFGYGSLCNLLYPKDDKEKGEHKE